jgi:tetratricopeptide (TPR) repeat protein
MMAHYFWRTGEQHQAIESAQRALGLSETASDLALKVSATYYLGLAYHALGQYDLAMRLLAENLRRLQGDLLLERFGMTGLPSVFCDLLRKPVTCLVPLIDWNPKTWEDC